MDAGGVFVRFGVFGFVEFMPTQYSPQLATLASFFRTVFAARGRSTHTGVGSSKTIPVSVSSMYPKGSLTYIAFRGMVFTRKHRKCQCFCRTSGSLEQV